eukprot:TRINITY_DN27420_c0_g1_i1.p1 TRINITY_DN27420_c0_g1~~TRINITY_DN27420_c0_g1_i1.p1  ORF type:complete len:546 (-),score=88.66 TRINITY_DN27420_c0_g1_i1:164-1801(-)
MPEGILSSFDGDLTQTQVVASQHTRERAAFKDDGVHARLTSLTNTSVCYDLKKEQQNVEIGRHPKCFIHVPDKRASKVHVRIFRGEKDQYYLEELSTNGCFINKDFMNQGDTRMLRHGDEVSLVVYARNRSETEKPFAAYLFTLVGDSKTSMVAPSSAVGGVRGVPAGSITEAAAEAAAARCSDGTVDNGSIMTEDWVHRRWDMRTVIGSGNFSEVRLGVNVRTAERRAVKVINKKSFHQFQKRRDSRLSLRSEAQTLISLCHPGIVQVFEWFETDSYLYLVMELLSDGDLLACILGDGCFTEFQARRLFRQLCEAVQYLHTLNVVHRDLKPENILVKGKDRNEMCLKIADFGLAWQDGRSGDCCQTFCGTPHYLSPEVIKSLQSTSAGHPAGYGRQADMWSLGVILYVMLSGVPPFDDEGLYEQIVEGKFEFDVREWLDVSPEAKELVRHLMKVNPVERLTIQQTLDHRWIRCAAPPSPHSKNDEASKAAAAAAAAAATAIAAGLTPLDTEPCNKRRRNEPWEDAEIGTVSQGAKAPGPPAVLL